MESKAEAMGLISSLMNFKATVNREIEKKDDNRGNKKDLIEQVVQTSLPSGFSIHIPLFKGREVRKINLEILIDGDDFACTLFSPNIIEMIEEGFDKMIELEIQLIKESYPELVVIEI